MLTQEEHNERMKYYQLGYHDDMIAEKVFVTAGAIGHWRKKNNLPCNSKFHKRNREKMELYNKGLSDREIAKILNVSVNTICCWRYRNAFENNKYKGQERRKKVIICSLNKNTKKD